MDDESGVYEASDSDSKGSDKVGKAEVDESSVESVFNDYDEPELTEESSKVDTAEDSKAAPTAQAAPTTSTTAVKKHAPIGWEGTKFAKVSTTTSSTTAFAVQNSTVSSTVDDTQTAQQTPADAGCRFGGASTAPSGAGFVFHGHVTTTQQAPTMANDAAGFKFGGSVASQSQTFTAQGFFFNADAPAPAMKDKKFPYNIIEFSKEANKVSSPLQCMLPSFESYVHLLTNSVSHNHATTQDNKYVEDESLYMVPATLQSLCERFPGKIVVVYGSNFESNVEVPSEEEDKKKVKLLVHRYIGCLLLNRQQDLPRKIVITEMNSGFNTTYHVSLEDAGMELVKTPVGGGHEVFVLTFTDDSTAKLNAVARRKGVGSHVDPLRSASLDIGFDHKLWRYEEEEVFKPKLPTSVVIEFDNPTDPSNPGLFECDLHFCSLSRLNFEKYLKYALEVNDMSETDANKDAIKDAIVKEGKKAGDEYKAFVECNGQGVEAQSSAEQCIIAVSASSWSLEGINKLQVRTRGLPPSKGILKPSEHPTESEFFTTGSFDFTPRVEVVPRQNESSAPTPVQEEIPTQSTRPTRSRAAQPINRQPELDGGRYNLRSGKRRRLA